MSEQVKEWYSAAELAGLPGMRTSVSGIIRQAKSESWQSRPRQGRGGGLEYHISSLPAETRTALAVRNVNSQTAREIEELATSNDQARTKQTIAEARACAEVQKADEDTRQKALLEQREKGLAIFRTLPEWKRRRAEGKARILSALVSFTRDGHHPPTEGKKLFLLELAMGRIELPPESLEVLGKDRSLTIFTLYRWLRQEEEEGIFGLVDHFGARRNKGTIQSNGRFESLILALKVEVPEIKPEQILKYMRKQYQDFPDIGERTIQRFLTRWIAEHPAEWNQLNNPDHFKNVSKVRAGDADEHIVALNQEWEMDSTPADVMLKDGRHAVLGVIDVYSRRIKLLVSKTSKSVMVAALLRRAILDWGIPQSIRTDNGQDYQSNHLRRVIKDLGIEQIFCTPFASEEKPFIERGLGTFSHDWVPLLPGYIGHSVADRKRIESRKSFADRTMKPDQVIQVNLTSEEFQKVCTNWTDNEYARNVHSKLGMSPFQKTAEWKEPIRKVTDERALDLLLMESGQRRINGKGIQMENGTYYDDMLASFVHRSVFVMRDPEDIGRICVFLEQPDGSRMFLCWAHDHERLGISLKEHATACDIVQKRAVKAARELLKESRKEIRKAPPHEVLAAAARERAGEIIAFPKGSVEHTSPALEAASHAVYDADTASSRHALIREAEAAARIEPSIESQKKVATIISLENRRKASEEDNEFTRFKRYIEFRKRNFAGCTAEELAWVKGYETLPECSGMMRVHGDELEREQIISR